MLPVSVIQHYGITGCRVFKGGIQNYKGFWLKINCSQMKLLNFENWSSGELSKIGHHFKNNVIYKLMLSKNVSNKKFATKLIFFNEKNY